MTRVKGSFEELRIQAQSGGSEAGVEKQRAKGKGTARERITELLDPGTFQEVGMFAASDQQPSGKGDNGTNRVFGDGVITGKGTIDGRPVYLFAQDFTVMGGSVGRVHGRKIAHIQDLAIKNGVPLIGLNDSAGARIQEGVNALAAYGEVFLRNIRASGIIPQISVILGPCAGGAVYSPALTDFIFMAEGTSQMFITGPGVIKEVTHEEIDLESLGGAAVHQQSSGVAHFKAADERAVFDQVRSLLSYLPSNNLTPPPDVLPLDDTDRATPELADIVPLQSDEPYDIHQVIEVLADNGEFLEIQEDYAPNIVIGFIRMNGKVVALVANQPDHLAGVIDINASDKAARFIRFCDCFHIPILTLVDTPGFLPGIDQEHEGIIRHGAKMIYAYGEASVPKITLILRKAYGGAYIVMGSKHLEGDANFAWPKAEIAVMGPQGAVKIINRADLAKAEDPAALQEQLAQAYREKHASPLLAAGEGYVDDIILPTETRIRIIQSLETFQDKRSPKQHKKHGNIPL